MGGVSISCLLEAGFWFKFLFIDKNWWEWTYSQATYIFYTRLETQVVQVFDVNV